MNRIRLFALSLTVCVSAVPAMAQTEELIPYADFERWTTRNIHESRAVGGKVKQVYEIAPNATVDGNKA